MFHTSYNYLAILYILGLFLIVTLQFYFSSLWMDWVPVCLVLQHAHAHSTGYFITQDSSFGNLILPVIPRLEPQSWPFTFAQCRIQMTYLVQIISVSFNCLLRHLSSLYKHSQGSINMLFNFVDLPSSLQLDCQQILQTLEIKCILKCYVNVTFLHLLLICYHIWIIIIVNILVFI